MKPNILMPIMIFMTRYCPDSLSIRRFFSVNHYINKIFNIAALAALILFLGSCEEDPSRIGINILPESDFVKIKSTDTISVFSYTNYEDAARSEKPGYSYLGWLNDPYFGNTSAEFVSQIRLGSRWGGGSYTVDSVKLFLRILDVQGDVESEQILTISEIAEQIYYDSAYYSNSPVPLTGYDAATLVLPALKADTINNLVLDLPVEFGNYLLRDTSQLFHSNSRPDFRAYFKGLYFRITSSTAPLLLTLKLAPPSSLGYSYNYFIVYYHDDSDIVKEYYFILDAKSKNAYFNRYSHDFSTADPDKKISHINDGVKDTLSYIQSLNGVYTNFTLPGLKDIKDNPSPSSIVVNRARLSVPVYLDDNVLKNSTVSSQIYLTYRTIDGGRYLVPDLSINQSFFDGTLDTVNKLYKFNIASFVQKYLEDTSNEIKPELDMLLPSGMMQNSVLKANSSSKPVKFEFTYTEF